MKCPTFSRKSIPFCEWIDRLSYWSCKEIEQNHYTTEHTHIYRQRRTRKSNNSIFFQKMNMQHRQRTRNKAVMSSERAAKIEQNPGIFYRTSAINIHKNLFDWTRFIRHWNQDRIVRIFRSINLRHWHTLLIYGIGRYKINSSRKTQATKWVMSAFLNTRTMHWRPLQRYDVEVGVIIKHDCWFRSRWS